MKNVIQPLSGHLDPSMLVDEDDEITKTPTLPILEWRGNNAYFHNQVVGEVRHSFEYGNRHSTYEATTFIPGMEEEGPLTLVCCTETDARAAVEERFVQWILRAAKSAVYD